MPIASFVIFLKNSIISLTDLSTTKQHEKIIINTNMSAAEQ